MTGSAHPVFYRRTYFRWKGMDVVEPLAELLLGRIRYRLPDPTAPESESRSSWTPRFSQ